MERQKRSSPLIYTRQAHFQAKKHALLHAVHVMNNYC